MESKDKIEHPVSVKGKSWKLFLFVQSFIYLPFYFLHSLFFLLFDHFYFSILLFLSDEAYPPNIELTCRSYLWNQRFTRPSVEC